MTNLLCRRCYCYVTHTSGRKKTQWIVFDTKHSRRIVVLWWEEDWQRRRRVLRAGFIKSQPRLRDHKQHPTTLLAGLIGHAKPSRGFFCARANKPIRRLNFIRSCYLKGKLPLAFGVVYRILPRLHNGGAIMCLSEQEPWPRMLILDQCQVSEPITRTYLP